MSESGSSSPDARNKAPTAPLEGGQGLELAEVLAPTETDVASDNDHSFHSSQHDGGDEEEGSSSEEQDGAHKDEEDRILAVGVPATDVKNIILQVLSPYFDDDGGAGGNAGGEDVEDDEDTAQRYDHAKSHSWIPLICDGIMERLIGLDKPYKYVVHSMIMRKCGAGMHVCSSNYYGQSDGWLSHAHDLSPHIYSVVTVYWSAI